MISRTRLVACLIALSTVASAAAAQTHSALIVALGDSNTAGRGPRECISRPVANSAEKERLRCAGGKCRDPRRYAAGYARSSRPVRTAGDAGSDRAGWVQ